MASKRIEKRGMVNIKAKSFDGLVGTITDVHERLAVHATRAVNISLTVRNWLIGFYIEEYELRGEDRGLYGEKLFSALANRLTSKGVSNCSRRQLYRYLDFYRTYPQIVGSLPPQFHSFLPSNCQASEKVGTLSPQFVTTSGRLLSSLSYSHLELLTAIEDPLERAFYEIECIRGNWSVRELKRQIASLYFERSGLSRDKKKLAELVRSRAEADSPRLTVRDPYVFEFLGIRAKEVMGESELEDSLLDRLQEFLLELGHGFCFEARQKRILIGDEHYFIDLVLYHRILKCHVLVELKADEFSPGYIGQLNTYLNWYRDNEMAGDDNPPVGILLCTQKDRALVKYALAGMDDRLFVSRYRLQLPDKEDIRRFLEEQMRRDGAGGR
ncbi:MAG: PDDEXK nuclease domain-containing protein [Methanopyri archaeon]|nr:PDDEXK nuclease domain-containing protein [Methanopyri archaeon]